MEAEYDSYNGTRIFLTVPPPSQKDYEKKHLAYKINLKAYKAWQGANKTQIDKHKVAEKKARAKRKLRRSMERLTKELEGVEAKLAKT